MISAQRSALGRQPWCRTLAALLVCGGALGSAACVGPWWGPSGDLEVTVAAGRCTAAFTHDDTTETRTGRVEMAPGNGLVCVMADDAGRLHLDLVGLGDAAVPTTDTVPMVLWGARRRDDAPMGAALRTTAFFPARSFRQLQSRGGDLVIHHWPIGGRSAFAASLTAQVRVRSGFASP